MLKEILKENAIKLDVKAGDKAGVIRELVEHLCSTYGLKNKKEIEENIVKRETLGSTGMGQGIAIPHCKMDGVDDIFLVIGISKQGIDFKALDGEPVYIFFMLVAPAASAGPHLKALARISRLLRDEYFVRSLQNAESIEKVYRIVITDDEKVS